MKEFVIDLFCGAGGTSTGILFSEGATVTACVNHDRKAIESHRNEHPYAKHFIEDIKNPEILLFLKMRVNALKKKYPDCIITLWASLECTNFSNAKGGLPRDADSRTLANHLFMYLDYLPIDYLMIENVREFMSWGPLDEKGKPISKDKGIDYLKWVNEVKSRGFDFEWRLLNSADYGGFTARTRYFAQFSRDGLPITWPQPTHSKEPTDSSVKQWKAVKEVLDLSNEGKSIFKKKGGYVENTEKRIYRGCIKYIAKGSEDHLMSISEENKSMEILQSYYGNGNVHSVEDPCPTLSTKDRFAKVKFFMMNYGNNPYYRSLKQPAGTVTLNDKHTLMTVDTLQDAELEFLINPQFNNPGNSVNKPSPTVIARQDKKPLGIIQCKVGKNAIIPVYDTDSETMIKIKKFMAFYGVYDIKMRMLEVEELLQIMGFPKDYKLVGNKTDQKKFIGNAVEVNMAKSLFKSHHDALKMHFSRLKLAA